MNVPRRTLSTVFFSVLVLALGLSADARPPVSRGYSIPLLDLAHQTERQVVVDREPGQYLGHPTTVLLEDGKSMIVVYPKGHGRGAIVMKRSADGGRTWSDRLPVPENWATSKEVPTLHRVIDPEGVKRLIMFSGLYPVRMAVSEDDGGTWTPLESIGNFGGIVTMGDVIRLRDGRYRAYFHDDGRFLFGSGKRTNKFKVLGTISQDGGLTWGDPEIVVEHPTAHLCEPGVVRSPDGTQLAMLFRENSRKMNSFVIFSNDEGETWTDPVEVQGALTGDRHVCRYAPDGRLVIVFRDTTHLSPTRGDFVAWVGTYEEILNGREGQYRVRLLDNKKGGDTGYPGLECLPDGTFVATTYGHFTEGEQPYIVSTRFKLEELDALARQTLPPWPEMNDVFISGKEGYHTYRIPAALVTRKGTVLAFTEGRISRNDAAENDIVLKRSTDGGRTWGPLQLIHEDGASSLNNPCAVEVRETGRVILFYQLYPAGLNERTVVPGLSGETICRSLSVHSDDDGLTWSKPKDITGSVKRPTEVTSLASGPGVGIQLRRGPHKGRLLMPFNQEFGKWKVYAAYSDDGGESWRYGDVAAEASEGMGNEVQMAERTDGSILLNSRSFGENRLRKMAVSEDGGESWSGLIDDPALIEPQCAGSVLRYSDPLDGYKSRLLFSCPKSKKDRHNGTVYVSYDEGETWPVSKTLWDYSFAYSCLTVLPDMTMGCLFERAGYGKIAFARFTLEWLTDGEDALRPKR